jgi:hypothetical protein
VTNVAMMSVSPVPKEPAAGGGFFMLPNEGIADARIAGASRIAVRVLCYNGEAAIGKVVADFNAVRRRR